MIECAQKVSDNKYLVESNESNEKLLLSCGRRPDYHITYRTWVQREEEEEDEEEEEEEEEERQGKLGTVES